MLGVVLLGRGKGGRWSRGSVGGGLVGQGEGGEVV